MNNFGILKLGIRFGVHNCNVEAHAGCVHIHANEVNTCYCSQWGISTAASTSRCYRFDTPIIIDRDAVITVVHAILFLENGTHVPFTVYIYKDRTVLRFKTANYRFYAVCPAIKNRGNDGSSWAWAGVVVRRRSIMCWPLRVHITCYLLLGLIEFDGPTGRYNPPVLQQIGKLPGERWTVILDSILLLKTHNHLTIPLKKKYDLWMDMRKLLTNWEFFVSPQIEFVHHNLSSHQVTF